MPGRIVVWITTPELPDGFDDLLRLESKRLMVRNWGGTDEGGGHAVLLVDAGTEHEARILVANRIRHCFGEELVARADVRTVPHPDDDAVFDDDEEEELDEGPLRCVRAALDWSEYGDGDEPALLRIHFIHSGSAHDAALAEVVVSESGPTVSISLFQRQVWGTYPDGATAAMPAVAVHGCVQVRLGRPLGQRRVIDGTTGLLARRVDDSSHREFSGHNGCPIWEP